MSQFIDKVKNIKRVFKTDPCGRECILLTFKYILRRVWLSRPAVEKFDFSTVSDRTDVYRFCHILLFIRDFNKKASAYNANPL